MLLLMTCGYSFVKQRDAAALAVIILIITMTTLYARNAAAHLDDNLRGVPPSPPAEWNYHGISAEESKQWIEEGIIFAAWAAQWKGEGFNARSAGQWHQITNVYTAGDFLKNGFGAQEAREWISRGIRSGKRAAEYLAAGLDAKEAGTFWERGLYPGEVKEWRDAGFDALATLDWRYGPRMGKFYVTRDARYSQRVYDVKFAKSWRDAGFAADEAHLASTYQYKLAEAKEWKDAGFPFREMVLWRDSGFMLEQAAMQRSMGLRAVEAELKQHDSTAREDEITEFIADITVNNDGTLDIIEIATVIDRPGGDYQEGYYKNIYAPSLECRLSSSATAFTGTRLHVTSVDVDGRPGEPVITDRAVNFRKNGAPLGEGEHRIILGYRTDSMVLDEPRHDELCYAVVGRMGKGTYLRSASATVRLPKGGHVVFSGGNAGLRDRKDLFSEIEETEQGDIVRYTVTRPLRQDMSFSIDVGFVKGYAQASWSQQFVQHDRKSRRFLSSLLIFISGLMVTSVYYWIAWYNAGRDPKGRRTALTEFSPPKDVDPPLMRALMTKGKTDHLSTTAELLSLAGRGFIRIFESEGTYKIERTQAEHVPPPHRDKEFLGSLFQERSMVILTGRPEKKQLARAGRMLIMSLNREYRTLTERNTRYLWPGMGLSVLFLGASLLIIDTSGLSCQGKAGAGLAAYGAVIATAFGLLSFLFSRLLRRPTREHVDLQERLRAYAAFLKRNFHDLPDRMYLPPLFQEHLPFAIAAGIDVDGLLLRSGEIPWYQGGSGGFACGDFISAVKRSQ